MIEAGGVKIPQYPSPLEVKMLIQDALHQELQKARADSYVEGYVDGIGVSGLGMPEDKKEELRQTIIDRYQSELDQPNK